MFLPLMLSIKKEVLLDLLESIAVIPPHKLEISKVKSKGSLSHVRSQWDYERSVRSEKLHYRSMQRGFLVRSLVRSLTTGIVEFEDVTERARGLEKRLDGTGEADLKDMHGKGLALDEKLLLVNANLQPLLDIEDQPQPTTGHA